MTLEKGRNGEMIVLRQGRKSMPLVWTHLLPSTFEGRARMNVQNALAATGAAWAAGAHLHDIRQGLRTFTTVTSWRRGAEHVRARWLSRDRRLRPNPPAVRSLGEFVDQPAEPSTTGRRRWSPAAASGDRHRR